MLYRIGRDDHAITTTHIGNLLKVLNSRISSIPLWRLVYFGLAFAVTTAALATPYPIELSLSGLGSSVTILVSLGAFSLLGWLAWRRPRRPLQAIDKLISERSIVDAALLFFTSTLFFSLLPPLKALIPSYAGFWADPFLAQMDRAILGRDAWELAHGHLPRLSAYIDILYSTWSLVITWVAAAISVCGSEQRRAKFFLTWALSWTVLGVVMASMLASAGPIFGPNLGYGYEALISANADASVTNHFRLLLWSMHGTNDASLGGGISAAPSMHCALSFIFVFASRGTRWFTPALLYAALIWLGSVYLGWHYAIDGALSLIGVVILWRIASRIVRMSSPYGSQNN